MENVLNIKDKRKILCGKVLSESCTQALYTQALDLEFQF